MDRNNRLVTDIYFSRTLRIIIRLIMLVNFFFNIFISSLSERSYLFCTGKLQNIITSPIKQHKVVSSPKRKVNCVERNQ